MADAPLPPDGVRGDLVAVYNCLRTFQLLHPDSACNNNYVSWIVITIVSSLFGLLYVIIYRGGSQYLKFRKIKRAFGKGVKSSKDIGVGLSLWNVPEQDRSAARFHKLDKEGHIVTKMYGPDALYSRHDVYTAAEVAEIFVNQFNTPILYVNDHDHGSLNIAGRSFDNNTMVLIGAEIANLDAKKAFNYLENCGARRCNTTLWDKFSRKRCAPGSCNLDRFPRFINITEDSSTKARVYIHVPGNKTSFHFEPNLKKDYGLVMRVPQYSHAKRKHYIYVIAGIHAETTLEGGKFFKQYWKEFCSAQPVAAIVFEVDRSRNEGAKPVYFEGFSGKSKTLFQAAMPISMPDPGAAAPAPRTSP